jgi:predicted RNA-binding Zn ribbon-like protein
MEHSFRCGNTALDFVGTLQPRRADEAKELLDTPMSLEAWFREGGIADDLKKLGPADLQKAISLREAIYSVVTSRMAGEDYDADALAKVNQAAKQTPVTPELSGSGSYAKATAEQALSTLARTTIELCSGPDAELLKECGRPGCTQVYLDRSRGGRREWCGMDPCGNIMKAAAYRARKRETQSA